MNKTIFAACMVVLGMNVAHAATTTDCLTCTDRNGNCTSYGATCCDPCKSSGGTLLTCPDECKDMYEWTNTNSGLWGKAITQTMCQKGACLYRCAAGYYGSPSSATDCTACPSPGINCKVDNLGVCSSLVLIGNSFATSADGSTQITKCYIPAGTYEDSTGRFTLSADCAYKR